MDLHDGNQCGIEVVRFRFLCVEDVHRVCAAGNGEDGGLVEVGGELDGIKCGRCDYQLQVFSLLYRLLEYTHTHTHKKRLIILINTQHNDLQHLPSPIEASMRNAHVWMERFECTDWEASRQ